MGGWRQKWGGTSSGGRGVLAAALAVSLWGRPWRHVAAGGGGVACGVVVGVASIASTSWRHWMRLRDTGGRPLGLVLLMLGSQEHWGVGVSEDIWWLR
jgi:hypothetical protein